MSLDFGTIVSTARQRYVDFYVKALRHARGNRPDVVGELLIAINNEAIPYPYRYVRADIVARGEEGSPRLSEVRLDIDEAFKPAGLRFGSFEIHVYPFTWNNVQILFDKPLRDLKEIEDWITRWLDVEDAHDRKEEGLSGAIHSFTQIETNGKWWYLTADFGTAPASALVEFVELLASQGMNVIVLKAG